MWLLIAFILVPIVEIALFIEVGGAIGLWPTLGVVVLTAVAGTALMRAQGMAVLAELQHSLESGGNPTGPIANGALILIAGVLLLTPGFFTDALGFALLLPPVRAAVIRAGAARLAGRFTIVSAGARRGGPEAPEGPGNTIDADYVELDPDEDAPRGRSGWTKPH